MQRIERIGDVNFYPDDYVSPNSFFKPKEQAFKTEKEYKILNSDFVTENLGTVMVLNNCFDSDENMEFVYPSWIQQRVVRAKILPDEKLSKEVKGVLALNLTDMIDKKENFIMKEQMAKVIKEAFENNYRIVVISSRTQEQASKIIIKQLNNFHKDVFSEIYFTYGAAKKHALNHLKKQHNLSNEQICFVSKKDVHFTSAKKEGFAVIAANQNGSHIGKIECLIHPDQQEQASCSWFRCGR